MIQLTNLNTNKRYLLAISGGLDSMVLLNLFNNSDYAFSVAHMNFQLRGEDSVKDQKIVEEYCNQNGIEVYSKKVNVESFKAHHSVSTQMAARDLRYTWFKTLVKEHKIDHLVTAHHTDDVLEGFLLNLGRGSGIEGLLNMWNIKEPIRPLLAYSKIQLYKYAVKNNLNWREDKSNEDDAYQRNYLRNNVIPSLKQTNKDFLARFKQSLDLLEDANSLNKKFVKQFKLKEFNNNYPISISKKSLGPVIESVTFLQLLFSEYGFIRPIEIQKLYKGKTGSSIHSKTYTLLNNRDEFLLYPLLYKFKPIEIKDLEECKNAIPNYRFVKSDQAESLTFATLDLDKIKFPVYLRSRNTGDKFYPTDFTGSKKLSKYFKDLKLSGFQKESVKLLVNNTNDIIWIIDYRFDRRFAANATTINYLNIYKL